MLVNHVRETQDSAYELIAYDFNALFSGSTRTGEELISQIQAVTVDDIVRVANGVKLDTVYFLRDRKEA
jgi:predicted Zn-dependent peptidase